MISREVASKVLSKCLITGGDFAEIFEEDSINNSIGTTESRCTSMQTAGRASIPNGVPRFLIMEKTKSRIS